MTSYIQPRRLLMLALLACVFFSVRAHAMDSAGVLDDVVNRYQSAAATWAGAITAAATRLFWSLALISMVWTFGMMAFRKAEIGEFFGELIRFVVFTGFFYFLLTNAPAIARAIMDSLKQLGGAAGGAAGLSPSGIVDVGFKVFSKVIDNSSVWDPVLTVIGAILGILILIVLAIVAFNMVVLLVSGWILAYAGIFFLGFGGAKWTSDIALNYYKTVLGIAGSLLGMTLLVGIGQAVINDYYAKMADVTVKDLAVIFVVAGLLLFLVNKIPSLIAGIITGASVGGAAGMGNAGAGTAMAAAAMAGAATAAAVSAVMSGGASLAGAGSAVKAAMAAANGETANGSGVGGMPSLDVAGGDGMAGAGGGGATTTPFGAAMGDGAAGESGGAGSGGGGAGSPAGSDEKGAQGTKQAAANDNGPGEKGTGGGKADTPKGGDFASVAEGGGGGGGDGGGRSFLGALGSGIAAVAMNKAGSVMDAAESRIAKTAGGKVAAEIRSPGSAAAERQNQADIRQSQTIAGKGQAARAFMSNGSAQTANPPAFTGDSLSAFNDNEKTVDSASEIAAFANRNT